MKEITEKQIEAIKKLAMVTKTEVNNIDRMSRGEASAVIDSLIEKTKNLKGGSVAGFRRTNDYKSDALAGLAVKILAQRHDVKSIIGQRDRFRERVKELYQVFSEAKQACLA